MNINISPYPPKRGWKEVRDPRVLKIYHEVVARAVELGYLNSAAESPSFYYTTRGNFIGVCHQKMDMGRYYYSYQPANKFKQVAIVIHVNVLSYSDENLREVLCHEMGHAICSITEGHSPIWRYYTRRIAEPWGVPVNTTISTKAWVQGKELSRQYALAHNRPTEFKWQLICPKCNKEFTKYKTMCESLRRPRYACPYCHEHLWKKNLLTGEISDIISTKRR